MKNRLIITLLCFISSASVFSSTPTQDKLNEINALCSNKPNPKGDHSYGDCFVTKQFPLKTDPVFIKKFNDLVNKSDLKLNGDVINSLFDDIWGRQIVYGNSFNTYTSGYNPGLIDKNGNEYVAKIYYAPYSNKLIIRPVSKDSKKYSHAWLGDVKDKTLSSAIVQMETSSFKSLWNTDWSKRSDFNDLTNTDIREVKVNLGIDLYFPEFKGYNSKFRLAHEKK